jgi:hypothetical protein
VAALFAVVGLLAFAGFGMRLRLGPLRMSILSAWRPWLWAVALLAFRNWLVPHPSTADQLVDLQRRIRRAFAERPTLRRAIAFDEPDVFEASSSAWRRAGGLALFAIAFAALVVVLTWPQIALLYSVPDLGDPLFSIWRISWVNHQLLRNPLTVFDTNIFYPERLTLTYSDPVLLPSIMVAPLFWFGVHQVVIYNLLFLSSFVFSAVTMFMLVRALTGRRDAAAIAAAIFGLYPYRFEHYSHLELQMTMWMPLALLAVHRTFARARLRDGLATGLAFALQALSSLYYGVLFGIYLAVFGGVSWLGRGRPRGPLIKLAAGVALAGVLIAPVAAEYLASKPLMGDRDLSTIKFYSAEPGDYLKSHFRSATYHALSFDGHPERQLFPRLTGIALTAVALWPPLSVTRIAYAAALFVAVDGSFGFNGALYPLLHAYVPPVRGLRVPARFSMLAGMTLAILSGYGARRLLERWPRPSPVLAAAMFGAVVIEALAYMPLEPVWREPPSVYREIPKTPDPVLAEFPMLSEFEDYDARYLYFSTFHWFKIVNGNSGFFPPSYFELTKAERDFPSDAAIEYLRKRGVTHIVLHGAFFRSVARFEETVAELGAKPHVQLVATAPWEGSETRVYRLW